jgi:hypothetical protein
MHDLTEFPQEQIEQQLSHLQRLMKQVLPGFSRLAAKTQAGALS